MKIIDNKKDYYDYLVSYYGLDNYIVYDRRNSKRVTREWESFLNPQFNLLYDSPSHTLNYIITIWAGRQHKSIVMKIITDCASKTKTINYISFEDYLMSLNPYYRSRVIENNNKLPIYVTKDNPLVISAGTTSYLDKNPSLIKNPILLGSPFTSIMTANEIWEGIYNFLLECKDPKIVDNRSDIEHLESHGFDKKTSFRNVK